LLVVLLWAPRGWPCRGTKSKAAIPGTISMMAVETTSAQAAPIECAADPHPESLVAEDMKSDDAAVEII
jgi:hypothetical protein